MPNGHDFWVYIEGQRGEEWEKVTGTRRFPVRGPFPVLANLPGYEVPQEIYLLALEAVETGMRDKIVAHLSQKFGLNPDEAAEEIAAVGIPILAHDCSVAVHNPQRWF